MPLPLALQAFGRLREALSPTTAMEPDVVQDLALVESTLMTATLLYDKKSGKMTTPPPIPMFPIDKPNEWMAWLYKTTPEQATCVLYNLMRQPFYAIPLEKFHAHANFTNALVFLVRRIPDVNLLVKSRTDVYFPLVTFSCIDESGTLTRELIARGACFHGYHPSLMPLDRMREFALAIGYTTKDVDTYKPIAIALDHIHTLPPHVQQMCTSL